MQRQALQPPPFPVDILGGLPPFRGGQVVAAQHIRIADDGGEGRFQLVGKVAHKVLLAAGGGLQLGHLGLHRVRHLVEVPGQQGHLVLPFAHRHPLAQLAPGNAAGGLAHPAQGAGQAGAGQSQKAAAGQGHRQQHPAVQPVAGGPVGIQVGQVHGGFHIHLLPVFLQAADHLIGPARLRVHQAGPPASGLQVPGLAAAFFVLQVVQPAHRRGAAAGIAAHLLAEALGQIGRQARLAHRVVGSAQGIVAAGGLLPAGGQALLKPGLQHGAPAQPEGDHHGNIGHGENFNGELHGSFSS